MGSERHCSVDVTSLLVRDGRSTDPLGYVKSDSSKEVPVTGEKGMEDPVHLRRSHRRNSDGV